MQSSRLLSALVALAMLAPGMSMAESQPRKAAISWQCEGERCVGRSAPAIQDLLAQCRAVVRERGPVSDFRAGGRALSDREVRACNRFVIATQPPRN